MGKPIFFPNIVISLIRNIGQNQSSNIVKFRIPSYMNKYDLHCYLSNIYKMNCKVIRMVNFPSRLKLGNRKTAEKKNAIVEII
jgi:ribosomal protein L23